jgi:hypothetical protein
VRGEGIVNLAASRRLKLLPSGRRLMAEAQEKAALVCARLTMT